MVTRRKRIVWKTAEKNEDGSYSLIIPPTTKMILIGKHCCDDIEFTINDNGC